MQTAKVGDFVVYYENADEFRELKREIWTDGAYYFETDTAQPRIIDLGAYLGLATLYWKRLYPASRIDAYEPNPSSYALLRRTIDENQIEGVSTFPVAVAAKGANITLYEDKQWQSTMGIIPGGWRKIQKTTPVVVPTVLISQLLSEPIDLLKMDVEGMEYELLRAADLTRVANLIVEVHPREGRRRDELVALLAKQGYHIEQREDTNRHGVGLVLFVASRT